GGHSCPSLLILFLPLPLTVLSPSLRKKSTSKATDKSVRPTHLPLCKILQHLQHAGPTAAVILARGFFLRQTAVLDLHLRSGFRGRQLPTHDGAAGFLVVPVRHPGIHEQPRWIVFQNLALTIELADAVDHDSSLLGGIVIMAAEPRVHLPDLGREVWGADHAGKS